LKADVYLPFLFNKQGEYNMERSKIRRKDRAITDYHRMLEIMKQCDICRLGLQDDESVYIVPLNFGFKADNEELTLYFHGFVKGKKLN